MGTVAGYVIYFIFCTIDYRKLQRWGYFAYLVLIPFLIATMIQGKIGLGARRWINLGLFTMQPSELTKIWFPAYLSYFIQETNIAHWHYTIPIVGIVIANFLLIAKQPDLGTALVTTIAGVIMLFHARRLSLRFLISLCILGLLGAPILWNCLHTYQKQRILVFFGAGAQHKERYQIEQARIAIGSGGLTGKGICRGTQNMLQFLPESRTDFIFAIVGEELGFLGSICIIFLYAILFWRILTVITITNDDNTQLLALGLALPILCATVINIGMVLELLPVVGIPLPFMSYGLTHSWISYSGLGWLQSILMRRSLLK